MALDYHIWLKIATHLPMRDFAALAATCRSDPLPSECGFAIQAPALQCSTLVPAQGCMEATLARAGLFQLYSYSLHRESHKLKCSGSSFILTSQMLMLKDPPMCMYGCVHRQCISYLHNGPCVVSVQTDISEEEFFHQQSGLHSVSHMT